MNPILFLFVFVFGTIIGSFLNVVILRYGTGRSLGGRSKCDITGKTLKWYELIPIFSFLIQGGRTRYGGAKISWQYPLVEFFTGILFVGVVYRVLPYFYYDPQAALFNILFYFFVFSCFVLIFVYDFRHQIIPNIFIYPLIIISGATIFLFTDITNHLLAGVLIALPVLAVWYLTHGKGMGFGDVKLLVPVGFILGLSQGFASLLIAFWIGAVVGIFLMIFKDKRWRSKISFGPFIIIAFMLVFFLNIDMSTIYLFFHMI
jgi:prepilin signal peptidase PulO-like enzyme (type II secretory pathway)